MDYQTFNGNTTPRIQPRVIIGGGGITGLALALMLEKVGIDFVVLEAYNDIAPLVGAGIACNANGFRILDQLGVYDHVMKAATAPMQEVNLWWPDGKLQTGHRGVSDILQRLTGYPMVVFDRQELLRMLYNQIQDKTKVITDARILSIEEDEKSVHVTTANGKQYTGDILVGVDGVHSRVREEMWRLAQHKAPGLFSDNEIDHIKCNWITVFGISALPDSRVAPGGANSTFNHGSSFGVLSGGNSKKYFFLNKALPKELKGREIPRYTDEDRDRLAEEFSKKMIQNDVTFGELYQEKIRSVLVPLQGYVFPRWHFGRLIILGDAAHKLHVVTGQGAMMGLEDAAVLVNQLMKQLGEDQSLPLDAARIERVFVDTQGARLPRTQKLMKASFLTQNMHSWKHPVLKFLAIYLAPALGIDFIIAQFVDNARPGPLVEALPKPNRGGLVGFDDSHPDLTSTPRTLINSFAYVSLILCGIWASIYKNAPAGPDPRFDYADGLFRLDMSGVLFVMLIEGWRRTNKISILQWPVMWALLADLFGFQTVSPIFFLVNCWSNSRRGRLQWAAPNRPVILSAAKGIFPIVTLFYMLPMVSRILMERLNTSANSVWNNGISAWPAATSAALVTLAFSLANHEVDTFFGKKYLGHLKIGYKCMFAALAVHHLSTLLWQVKHGYLLWPLPARLAELVWLLTTYSEVHFYHRVRWNAFLSVALIVVGFVVVGPGATTTAVWYWRERLHDESQTKIQSS